MRLFRPLLLALALPLLVVACGDDDEQKKNPCEGVTCPAGHDCVGGVCIERPDPNEPEGCRSNANCFQNPQGQLCDRGTGECVHCLADAHCGARVCVSGNCVGNVCTTDDDCDEARPFCNEAGTACVACLSDADCGEAAVCEAGACFDVPVPCESDEACAEVDPGRPFCDTDEGRGLCVACRHGGDCGEGEACRGGACFDVRCDDDGDCSHLPDLPLCGGAGRCVACAGDGDCPAGKLCNDGVCEAPFRCDDDGDCAGHPAGGVCDTVSGACVVCRGDGDCAAGQRCQNRVACVPIACIDTGDCPVGSVCNGTVCMPAPGCGSDAECDFDPRAPWCGGSGCVACLEDGHCGRGESCVESTCVRQQECAVDSDCGGGFVCTDGLCNACRTDAECPRGTCSGGACVDRDSCTGDGDCAGGVCSAGRCAACATSLDCPAGLWCDAGACVQAASCGTNAPCGPGKVCNAGSCVSAACENDRNEPDDRPALAVPYVPGTQVTGTLCPQDEDWFVFSAAAGSGLSAQLAAAPAGAGLSVAWYETGSRALRVLEGIDGRVMVRQLPAAAAGRYYLRVRAGGASGSYGLSAAVAIGGGACTDVLEPNDVRTAPRAVQTGRWMDGLLLCGSADADFYSVQVPAGRWLQAYVFPANAAEVEVEIFNATGTERLGSGSSVVWMGGGKMAAAAPAATAQTLLVKVSMQGTATRPYAMYIAADANPNCNLAPQLFASGTTAARVASSTLGRNADQGAGACGAGGPDTVWRVAVPEASRFLATVQAPYPARLSLRAAGCADELGCAATLASGVGTLDVAQLPAGDYALVVGGPPNGAGPFELAAQLLAPMTPPANDACGDSTWLDLASGSASASGTTLGAASDGSLSCGPGAPEVYYGFTVPTERRVVIDVAADGLVSVQLADAATCGDERLCSGPQRTVRIDRVLPAGDYALAVASSSGVPVSFSVAVSAPEPVGNDSCAAATTLPVPGTASGDTTWASNTWSAAPEASCTGYFTGGNDAFYRITLAAGQTVTATLTPAAGYDAALYLAASCDGGFASCRAGVDAAFAGGQETLQYTSAGGGTYLLVVDGVQGGGAYSLHVQ